jgi:hypothetical protein
MGLTYVIQAFFRSVCSKKYRLIAFWKTFAVRGRLYNEKAILNSKETYTGFIGWLCDIRRDDD